MHERQYHLFVISQDMEYFQHIHPEQQAGRHVDDRRDAAEGRLLQGAVGLSSGRRRVAVHRAAARHRRLRRRSRRRQRASGAGRRPDEDRGRHHRDAFPSIPPTFIAGLYGHLNFHLTDTATGRPITDLQTYLGAFGHTLIMSEDMVDYVHSHPLDILAMPDDDGGPPQFLIPPGADLEKLRGGPDVTFEGLMPKPGRYRAWTQFRRNDKLLHVRVHVRRWRDRGVVRVEYAIRVA